jgi:integrase
MEAGKDQSWGDVVAVLATTALRISEVSGLRVGDIDLVRGLIHVHRQTYPGRGGLVTKETKGRRRRTVPIIDPLRPTLVRLTTGRRGEDALVTELGQPGLVRHGLRYTALTWMADAGIDLHILQRVAGHQDPAVAARYLLPDVQRIGQALQEFLRL